MNTWTPSAQPLWPSPWAFVGPFEPVWAHGPLWAPSGLVSRALVGPSGPLWAGPLRAPWALVGWALGDSPGSLLAEHLWAACVLVGPLGPCGLSWALLGPCGP